MMPILDAPQPVRTRSVYGLDSEDRDPLKRRMPLRAVLQHALSHMRRQALHGYNSGLSPQRLFPARPPQ